MPTFRKLKANDLCLWRLKKLQSWQEQNPPPDAVHGEEHLSLVGYTWQTLGQCSAVMWDWPRTWTETTTQPSRLHVFFRSSYLNPDPDIGAKASPTHTPREAGKDKSQNTPHGALHVHCRFSDISVTKTTEANKSF